MVAPGFPPNKATQVPIATLVQDNPLKNATGVDRKNKVQKSGVFSRRELATEGLRGSYNTSYWARNQEALFWSGTEPGGQPAN